MPHRAETPAKNGISGLCAGGAHVVLEGNSQMCERRGHIGLGHDRCDGRRITEAMRSSAFINFPI
jgi:hypothetical protein